jgi:hypothetical protein
MPCVGPNLHPADPVGPAQDGLELGLVLEAGIDGGQGALVERTGRPVQADPVALLELRPGHVAVGLAVGVVDEEVAGAGDAGLADLAGDDRGMRGGSAPGGDDALGHGHAVEVVGRGFDPDEDDLLAVGHPFDGLVGIEDGPAHGRAGRGVQAVDDLGGALEGLGVEGGAEELVHHARLDPPDGLLFRDDPLLDHVDGDLHGGRRGSLRRARLEHVEAAPLDRELEVLDVAVVMLQAVGDPLELVVDGGHRHAQLGDGLRGSNAGHHVLALGVGEVLAEEMLLAGVRVAGEGHPGPRVVAHVAEDHGHDVDGSAQVVGDLVVLAIVAGALPEPGGEDGLDGQVKLLVGVLGEVAAGDLADDPAGLGGDALQVLGREVRVQGHAAGPLGRLEGVVEALTGHVHDDPSEHLDEAPIGVPAEAIVARELDQALEGRFIQAQVEDRVHHPRHREAGARADGYEERVGRVAEALARLALDLPHGRQDVLPEPLRELFAGIEVVVAGLGRDGEARRDGEAGIRHLGQAGALAAQEVSHRGVTLGRAAAPRVDVALGSAVGALGPGGGGHVGWAPSVTNAARQRAAEIAGLSARLYRRRPIRPLVALGSHLGCRWDAASRGGYHPG